MVGLAQRQLGLGGGDLLGEAQSSLGQLLAPAGQPLRIALLGVDGAAQRGQLTAHSGGVAARLGHPITPGGLEVGSGDRQRLLGAAPLVVGILQRVGGGIDPGDVQVELGALGLKRSDHALVDERLALAFQVAATLGQQCALAARPLAQRLVAGQPAGMVGFARGG